MPKRIQLRRTKGWRKPEGAVVVARPTKWGNPFPAKANTAEARAEAVAQFVEHTLPGLDLADLRGKDLCCWCPLDQPCHADLLLEAANA